MDEALREHSGASGLQEKGSQAAQRLKELLQWSYLHGRRLFYRLHDLAAGRNNAGPVTFLAVSAALGVALTVSTLYTPSYAVYVDGQEVGVVAQTDVVEDAVRQVEAQGSALMGYDFHLDSQIDYQFALTLRSDLTSQSDIQQVFYEEMDEVGQQLRKYQISVNGVAVGSMESQEELQQVLQQLKDQYTTENTISAEFNETISYGYVYNEDTLMNAEEMLAALTANTTGQTTYTVVKGDTFNAIAYANNMSVSDLKALNPGVDINNIMVGDVLTVKEEIPLLSVTTVEDVTYSEEIPCPVEEKDDSSMYIGESKIVTQGTPGESSVNAQVTYVNGKETGREILSTTTVREPTTTVKAVGTKEKPKTASTGSFCWPVSGTITSYFGGRYIFGGYSYHSGLDIATSYGRTIVAADGGTVTFSGYKGSYGNLVIITHDNGTKTYYGHCSSLLVSAGTKVYKGQAIAKVGSTGNSTGNHCHFEVRVNGTAVNPLNYLS